MTKEELTRNLKYTEENIVNTFSTNISMMCSDVLKVLENCIEITDEMTNGDILMSMFPNESFRILDNTVYTTIDKVGNTIINSGCWFSLSWWNAPYKNSSN